MHLSRTFYFGLLGICVLVSPGVLGASSSCLRSLKEVVQVRKEQDLSEHLKKAADLFRRSPDKALEHILVGEVFNDPQSPLNFRIRGGLHSGVRFGELLKSLIDFEPMLPHFRSLTETGAEEALTQEVSWLFESPHRLDLVEDDFVSKRTVSEEIWREGLTKVLKGEKALLVSNELVAQYNLSRAQEIDLRSALSFAEFTIQSHAMLGLDIHSPVDRFLYLHRRFFVHQGPDVEESGVIKTVIDPHLIRSKTWRKKMLKTARRGVAPLGAKTFFPAHWGAVQISKAIQEVLRDEKSMLVRADRNDSRAEFKNILIQGTFEGVEMRVALYGEQVVSAYPVWFKDGEVAESFEAIYDRVSKHLQEFIDSKGLGLEPISIGEAVQIYLQEKPHRLSQSAYHKWALYLDPLTASIYNSEANQRPHFYFKERSLRALLFEVWACAVQWREGLRAQADSETTLVLDHPFSDFPFHLAE